MPSDSIVDGRLFTKLDIFSAGSINSAVLTDRDLFGHLASQLLLYERIVIPTYDFGIVPALVTWFGSDLYSELVNEGTLAFIRRKGLLGYVGNGNGISTFGIERRSGESTRWWVKALFCNNDEAIDLQLRNSSLSLDTKDVTQLLAVTMEHSRTLEYENEFFIENIANESYRDVMGSPGLSRFVLRTTEARSNGSIDLRCLPQVKPNQLRFLPAEGAIKDAVDILLRVAEVNMELLTSDQMGDADLFTSQGSDFLLTEKMRRAGASEELLSGFINLLELTEIPDIRWGVAKGILPIQELLEIRNGSNARQFREWLRTERPHDSKDFVSAYIRALGKDTLADKFPVRLIRLAATSIVSLIPGVGGLLGGLAADTVDSFFVEKWLKGYSPKLFLDELQRILPDSGRAEV